MIASKQAVVCQGKYVPSRWPLVSMAKIVFGFPESFSVQSTLALSGLATSPEASTMACPVTVPWLTPGSNVLPDARKLHEAISAAAAKARPAIDMMHHRI